MNNLITFSLLAAVTAFTTDKAASAQQNPFFNSNACPSTLLLSNGECQRPSVDVSFHTNDSQTISQSFESAQNIEYSPWTFWPECFSNEDQTEPMCVFSHQSFAKGRGIFIVSTTENAYGMLQKPAFTNPSVLDRTNSYTNPPYIIQEMPGRGRGLIANKTLHRGDQIFASTPLLISNPNAYKLAEEERLRLSHRGVETLPQASKNEFWKLLDHFKGDPVDDRINTNAFEIEINGVQHYAVLPEIAMTNHDCRPNAAYFWDEEALSHYVHATQTIYPGEEITITYINNERVREKRIANLKRNWGFECSCSSCSAHPEFVKESDDRIEQMNDLFDKLEDWTEKSEATPEMALTLISLYEQERLFASLGVAYKHAAEAYSSFGDKFNAIKYARLAVELMTLDRGFRDTDVGNLKKMAEDPEQVWSWKKRVGMKRFAVSSCGHVHERPAQQ
jgi:hypothetical protein